MSACAAREDGEAGSAVCVQPHSTVGWSNNNGGNVSKRRRRRRHIRDQSACDKHCCNLLSDDTHIYDAVYKKNNYHILTHKSSFKSNSTKIHKLGIL